MIVGVDGDIRHRAVDPTQPVFGLESMETRVTLSLSQRRERPFLLGVFAALAFAIAVIDVYGVSTYSVAVALMR